MNRYTKMVCFCVDTINGSADHCHCLISMGTDRSVQDVMHMIKGESSFWINKNKLTLYKFAWQQEYYANSVCVGNLPRVRKYIKNH